MRFLCLHGKGMNAEVLRSQMARICEFFTPDHEFTFVNGPVPREPMAGIALKTRQSDERYFGFTPDDPALCGQIIDSVSNFMASAKPFDGIIGFSEGACVAATIMIADEQLPQPVFRLKCGIFFCGLSPIDIQSCSDGKGEPRFLNYDEDGVMLRVPTAHIWSTEGGEFANMGKDLVTISDEGLREESIHRLGHEIPGSRSDEGLEEAIRAIERTIERAK
ncbi:hypothetical protein V2G26_002384 [Clonostachys chloroleuca]